MPATVMFGKDGTIFSVGSENLLATFETCEISIDQDLVEHHGPQDDYAMRTPRRVSATLTAEAFVTSTEALGLIIPLSTTALAVTCDLIDGRDFKGNFHCSGIRATASDDPSKQSITLESTGSFSIT